MARPRYESAANRADEAVAKASIEKWGQCTLCKLETVEYLDWKAYRGDKLVAVIEFKRRKNPRLQYPTYMVASEKWKNGILASKQFGVPFIFTVQWDDGLYFLKVDDSTPVTRGKGGRRDRNDPMDIEEMVYIDTSLFTLIPR